MYNYISETTVKKLQGELDSDAFTSPGHPALEDLPLPPPHLQRAWQQCAQQAAPQEVEKGMSVLEFSDVVRFNRATLQDEDDLWAMARTRQDANDRKLMPILAEIWFRELFCHQWVLGNHHF